MKKNAYSRNQKLATIVLSTIPFVIYVLIFIYFVHIKQETFRAQKAEILISAGYSAGDVDNVVVWWQNGHYYVNGQHYCGNYLITTGIDNLIKTNESLRIFTLLMIMIGILLIILLRVMYHYITTLTKYKIDSDFLTEQAAIKKKRETLEIYNCCESSEVIGTDVNKSKEHNNSED